MKRWRKVNKVPDNKKVFFVSHGYSSLIKYCESRGWVRNKNI